MNKRGQSIIEYALIAVLVILGVVVMGPYVLRSLGAHFKLWDDGVKDSFTEHLNQAPVNDVPDLPTCGTCSYIPGSCGSTVNSGTGSCLPSQREYDLNCGAAPIGCSGQPASTCQDDPTCCTGLVNVGCGTTPLGQTPPSNNCNYGYQMQAQQCGSNSTVTCTPDSNCPLPACLGVIPQGTTACPGTTNGLTQNWGISAVEQYSLADCGSSPNCTYCDPAQKCQYVMGNPPISCIYSGGPFSGTYDGNFNDGCNAFSNDSGQGCNRNNGSHADQNFSAVCSNNYLTGMNSYNPGHWQDAAGPRGINNVALAGDTASDILCNGISGSITLYWQNCHNISSCYDGVTYCPNYSFNSQCGGGSGSCPEPACSNDSFTINCDGTGHFRNITFNNASPSFTPVPMHGCNWSGAETFYDFGGGDDMIWTCDTSSGQGVVTQVEFTPINGGCNGPTSSTC